MNHEHTFDPFGSSVADVQDEKAATDPEYAAAVERFAFSETIARMLIGYRMEHDLTQKQLAEIVKMPIPVISRLESGDHSPNVKTVEKLCQALGKSIEFHDNVSHRSLQPA